MSSSPLVPSSTSTSASSSPSASGLFEVTSPPSGCGVTSTTTTTSFSPSSSPFPFVENVDKYQRICKIGQGTYGDVYKAFEKSNPEHFVALKMVKQTDEEEGFPITSIREIKIMKMLKHRNIVSLIEVCREQLVTGGGGRRAKNSHLDARFYLVFEYCDNDLAGLLANPSVSMTDGERKGIMKQILDAIYFLHESGNIMHRDVKTSNILINRFGVVKLADFGLSKALSKVFKVHKVHTNRVVTLWYRPPELLLGTRKYSTEVDLWGVGCIMAELWTRTPILQGDSEHRQLSLIIRLCGPINPKTWPSVTEMPLFGKFMLPSMTKRRVKERLIHYVKDEVACDLIDRLLCLDPKERITADEALNHNYFWSGEEISELDQMLSGHGDSMFEFTSGKNNKKSKLTSNNKKKSKTVDQSQGFASQVY